MNNNFFKAFPWVLISVSLLTSCVSTETLEPGNMATSTQEIVLNINTPSEAKTRGAGYKLRYSAKIYEGTQNIWNKPLERQEIIDGESDNQIIFKVPANSNYGILVFADYIPEDSQPNSEGLYADYFYDTTSNSKISQMRTTPGSANSTVSSDFFNNDYYDAFFGSETFLKGVEEKIVDMTLNRTTAKIIFRDNSDLYGDCSISLNTVSVFNQFYQDDNTIFSSPTTVQTNGITFSQSFPENTENKDLFFFYTLAEDTNVTHKVKSSFTVTNNGVQSDVFTISDIPVKANYKTIVTGKFLTEDSSDNPGGEEEPQEGDIILNLTTNFGWEQESLSN